MNLFPLILTANFTTLVITIIAAIKFRAWSYRLTGVIALIAVLFALFQFETGTYHPATLVFSALLNGFITIRVLTNLQKLNSRPPGT